MSQELDLTGTDQDELLRGSDTDDSLHGLGGDDTLYGRDGNDFLAGGAGNDLLHGGRGGDAIFLGAGRDTVYGGDGADSIFYRGQDLIFAGAGDDLVFVESGHEGAAGQTVVHGGAGNDMLRGGAAQTWLLGGSGQDSLWGGVGRDTLEGGSGDDQLFFSSDDVLIGGRGRDEIFKDFSASEDAAVELVFNQGDGKDEVYGLTRNTTLTFADETRQTLRVTADSSGDLVFLHGSGDRVALKQGLAEYNLAKLPTTIQLADGDSISLEELVTSQTVRLSAGDDLAHFLMGWDERVEAGLGNDSVWGHGGQDVLLGGQGNDLLDGGQGHDLLKGGAGHDLLFSASGDDTLIGGAGNDTLVCGTGADTVLLNSRVGTDVVANFTFGEDRLLLSQRQLGAIGDGDRHLEGTTVRNEAGGFATTAELVQFSTALSGLGAQQAASAIGSAQEAYAEGQSALFLVHDGWNAALYRFESSGADASVSADELTLLAELAGHTSADPAAFWLMA